MGNKIVIILIFIIFFIFLMFRLLNKKVSPILLEYAEQETEKLATLIINSAITKQVVEGLTMDNLFILTTDEKGEIISIDFNSVIVNKVLTTTTSSVEMNLKYLEQGKTELLDLPDNILVNYENYDLKNGIIYEIPIGIVFQNSFLSNLGPKIPVRINLIGSIVSSVETKVTNYGINNALIEVYIKLKLGIKVILPFTSDKMTVETLVPVALKLVRGNVPEYYANGYLSSPLLSIPVE